MLDQVEEDDLERGIDLERLLEILSRLSGIPVPGIVRDGLTEVVVRIGNVLMVLDERGQRGVCRIAIAAVVSVRLCLDDRLPAGSESARRSAPT